MGEPGPPDDGEYARDRDVTELALVLRLTHLQPRQQCHTVDRYDLKHEWEALDLPRHPRYVRQKLARLCQQMGGR